MTQSVFEAAVADLPGDVAFDAMAMRTLDDLRYACHIQLDLIEECQDGTENDDPLPIRRWLDKYGRLKPLNRGAMVLDKSHRETVKVLLRLVNSASQTKGKFSNGADYAHVPQDTLDLARTYLLGIGVDKAKVGSRQ